MLSEDRRLEAEIRQLEADAAKLDAQRKALRSWGHWSVEFIKVFAAVILGAGGLVTGVTGYYVAEIKTERKQAELERLEVKLDLKGRQLAEVEQKLREADTKVATASGNIAVAQRLVEDLQLKVRKTKTDLAEVQRQLASARKTRPGGNKPSIDAAINRTTTIEHDVDDASAKLQEMLRRFQLKNSGL